MSTASKELSIYHSMTLDFLKEYILSLHIHIMLAYSDPEDVTNLLLQTNVEAVDMVSIEELTRLLEQVAQSYSLILMLKF